MPIPIRGMAITAIMLLVATYLYIAWLGGYEYSQKIAMNSTLALEYNSIIGNSSNPNGLLSITNYSTQGSNLGSALRGAGGAFAVIGAAAYAGQFLATIPNTFVAFSQFLAQPLIAFGIPANYAIGALLVLQILLIGLAILSAILIFPI